MSVTASLMLGALLGIANAAVALLVARRGRTMTLNQTMKLVVGGGMLRLAVLLAAVVGILVSLPVHRLAFVGGLGVLFVAGLLAEVALVLGRPATDA